MKAIIIVLIGMIASTQSVASTADCSASRIESLKKEILKIGEKASGKVKYDNEDNDPAVRAKLDALIAELKLIAPAKTQAENLKRVVGAWKSVWSDLGYNFGDAPLANSVYQVVFPDGYYYNLSNFDSKGKKPYAGVIKGEFQLTEPALKIKFVLFAENEIPFKKGSDLATLAMRAELGEFDKNVGSPALGFESIFEQVYVDEDIRIATGLNFDGSNTLFVLKRATKVE